MHFRYDHNFLLLWFFLVLQILILISYLTWTSSSRGNVSVENLPSPVKFVREPRKNGLGKKLRLDKYQSYYNVEEGNDVYLKTQDVENYFLTLNNVICFKDGTDVEYMKRNAGTRESEKCECLPGYHGNDCSLPEVIWRAFIALGRETVIHKRNSHVRRIVHMFRINHPGQIPLAVIKISELFSVVDLFIVLESNKTEHGGSKSHHFKLELDKGLLGNKQHKIVHVPIYEGGRSVFKTPSEISWEKSRKLIKNLRHDDLFIQMDASEIPSSKALLFFKLYDGFSLPLQFRLKWNVYGYFYQHPNKTKKITTGSTVRMLDEIFKNDPDLIRDSGGLVVGDLNHYGGWFCDLCYDPKIVLDVVRNFETALSKVTKVIDVKYLEEIIGDGLYIDGKTLLVPNHEEREIYYAPRYVADNFWQYDSLMINLYSRVDYN